MYVMSRLMRARSGAAVPQAIQMTNYTTAHINSTHGTEFGVGVQIGGDPLLIGITGGFESLADYEKLRAALQTDQEFQAALQMGDHLYDNSTEDTLWNVRIPPGEQDAVSQISSVRVELTRIVDAMTFAAEVATTVSGTTGNTVGVATAATGDRSRLVWVGYGPSLAQVEQDGEALEANEEYLDLFKKSEGVLQPNTLEQNIWMRVSE
jgi:hypothetical protein